MVQRMVDGDEGGSAGLVLVSTLRRGIRREQYQQQDLDKVIKTSIVVCVCARACGAQSQRWTTRCAHDYMSTVREIRLTRCADGNSGNGSYR